MLWNPSVHYRILESLPIVPLLNQISVVQAPILFLNIDFNVILSSMRRISKLLLASSFNPYPANVENMVSS